MKRQLQDRFPHVDPRRLADLAAVWGEVVTGIIEAMFRKADVEIRLYNEETRAELTLELAKLFAYMEGLVLEEMVRDRNLEELQVAEERARLQAASERAKVENTGALYYEHVWKRLVEMTHARNPLVRGPGDRTRRRQPMRLRTPTGGTQVQHFSPSFSNRRWATGPQNQVREYRLNVGLEIVSTDKGFRSWGHADFIYSQELERRLGLVEGDASPVYEKLLQMIPLSTDEVSRWVAFIATQHMRTPRYRTLLLRGLARHRFEEVRRARPDEHKRVYEQMFTASPMFGLYHRLVVGHEWFLLDAPPGEQFIRADEPLLLSRMGDPWRVVYPMTPTRCFVVGRPISGRRQTFAPVENIGCAQVHSLNRLIAANARESVIAQRTADDRQIKGIIREGLLVGVARHGRFSFEDDLWSSSLSGLMP